MEFSDLPDSPTTDHLNTIRTRQVLLIQLKTSANPSGATPLRMTRLVEATSLEKSRLIWFDVTDQLRGIVWEITSCYKSEKCCLMQSSSRRSTHCSERWQISNTRFRMNDATSSREKPSATKLVKLVAPSKVSIC